MSGKQRENSIANCLKVKIKLFCFANQNSKTKRDSVYYQIRQRKPADSVEQLRSWYYNVWHFYLKGLKLHIMNNNKK